MELLSSLRLTSLIGSNRKKHFRGPFVEQLICIPIIRELKRAMLLIEEDKLAEVVDWICCRTPGRMSIF